MYCDGYCDDIVMGIVMDILMGFVFSMSGLVILIYTIDITISCFSFLLRFVAIL